MLRLTRKFLTIWEKPRLSAEVRGPTSAAWPSERYNVRQRERGVKVFLAEVPTDSLQKEHTIWANAVSCLPGSRRSANLTLQSRAGKAVVAERNCLRGQGSHRTESNRRIFHGSACHTCPLPVVGWCFPFLPRSFHLGGAAAIGSTAHHPACG